MNCIPIKQHHGGYREINQCCCGSAHGHGYQVHFLSKKKKIEMLNKHINILKEKIEDIEAYIEELGGK